MEMTPLDITPNRHSLFFPLGDDLHRWVVFTPLFRFLRPVKVEEFRLAISKLISLNNGLQLQVSMGKNGVYSQYIYEEVADKYVLVFDVSYFSNDEVLKLIQDTSRSIADSFTFPGPLFKAVLFFSVSSNEYFVRLIVHHLLVDTHSMRLMTNQFFEIYEKIILSQEFDVGEKRADYSEYVSHFMQELKNRKSEHIDYWAGRNWGRIKQSFIHKDQLLQEGPWLQRDSIVASFKVALGSGANIAAEFSKKVGHSLIELILLVSSCAYVATWDKPGFYLALAHHNRDRLSSGFDSTRVIGWLSSVYPFFVTPLKLDLLSLQRIRLELSDLESFGNGFGFIKYGYCMSELSHMLEPGISLNYIDKSRSSFNYRSLAANDMHLPGKAKDSSNSQRQYLLCGGVIVEKGEITIQWDYSKFSIKPTDIDKFLKTYRDLLLRAFSDAGLDALASDFEFKE